MKKRKIQNKYRQKNRIKNWEAYNKALVKRGSLEIWMEEESLKNWLYEGDKVKGGNFLYSHLSIKLCLTLRSIYSLPLRQTTGFLGSISKMMRLKLPIPDYTTLSRRAASLEINLPKLQPGQSFTLVVDSTGLKIYESGEWKNKKKEGKIFRKSWRKLHICMGSEDQIIYSSQLTSKSVGDSQMIEPLLAPHAKECSELLADGAYDKGNVYYYLSKNEIKPTIPPQKNARLHKKKPHYAARDKVVEAIGKSKAKRKLWEKEVRYSRRLLVETCMYRYKKTFGERLSFRREDNRKVETLLNSELLNKMWSLGRPESYKVA